MKVTSSGDIITGPQARQEELLQIGEEGTLSGKSGLVELCTLLTKLSSATGRSQFFPG